MTRASAIYAAVGLSLAIFLLGDAKAQTLPQLVEQLRANPTDDALRNQTIEKARATRPAPAVPEEARRFLARGIAAFKLAKSPQDFAPAVAEFQKASDAAPWWGDPYFNLGQALEQAGDPAAAIRAYRFYLAAVPGAADAGKVQSKIYELEYVAEKKVKDDSAKAAADTEKSRKQRWAADIVAELRRDYSGSLLRNSVCFVPSAGSFCTDQEAEGSNWRPVLNPSTNSPDLSSMNEHFGFEVVGDEKDQIQINVASDSIHPICGVPSNSNSRDVAWRHCNSSLPPERRKARVSFGRSKDDKPLIHVVRLCDGPRCYHGTYVLAP